jgi:hypothetical protein
MLGVCAAISVFISSGCASYVAMNQPAPTDDQLVGIGMHRAEVEQILRTGGSAYQEPNDHVRVRYEYSDGAHQGTKARVLLYIAADLFTLFLSELIFWPIELAVQQNAERTAAADYDGSNRLGHFRAMKRRSRRETINIGSGVYEILPGAIEETASEKEAAREKRTLSKARK